MTSPTETCADIRPVRGDARRSFSTARLLLIAGAACAGLLGACSEPPPPPPPPPAAPPPPPPPALPDEVDREQVLRDVGADPRVRFPEGGPLYDPTLAEAAVRLANAFATGDETALRDLLDEGGQRSLDRLVNSGVWYDVTGESLEAVSIFDVEQMPRQTAEATEGGVALALASPEGAEVLGFLAANSGGGWTFSQLQTTPEVRATAAEWEGTRFSEIRGDANLELNRDLLAYFLYEVVDAALKVGLKAPEQDDSAAMWEPAAPWRQLDSTGWANAAAEPQRASRSDVGQARRPGSPGDTTLPGSEGSSGSTQSATPGTSGVSAWTIVAAMLGVSEDEAKSMYERGDREFKGGAKPTPMLVHSAVSMLKTAGQAYGLEVSEDAVLNTIAEIAKMPFEEVKLLNSQAEATTAAS